MKTTLIPSIVRIFKDSETVKVRPYSGRGMNGKHCLSITGTILEMQEAIGNVIEDFADASAYSPGNEEIEKNFKDVLRTMLHFREDNLGLDYVWYWPKIEYSD